VTGYFLLALAATIWIMFREDTKREKDAGGTYPDMEYY